MQVEILTRHSQFIIRPVKVTGHYPDIISLDRNLDTGYGTIAEQNLEVKLLCTVKGNLIIAGCFKIAAEDADAAVVIEDYLTVDEELDVDVLTAV